MLENLEIKEKDDTPYVMLDATSGYCMISGKSYPPDVSKFFDPVLNWLDFLKGSGLKELTFNFKLDYYNTASSKIMLDMLYKLEEFMQEGAEIIVNWYYPDDDEELLDAGEEFERVVDIPFRLIAYEKDYN